MPIQERASPSMRSASMSLNCGCAGHWKPTCAPPGTELAARAVRTGTATERLRTAWTRSIGAAQARVELAARALQAVSPLATLQRGFAIIARADDGTVVRHSAQLSIGEQIEARLADGVITARVTGRRTP